MKNEKPCCDVLEKIDIHWMKFDDGNKCAPYVMGKNDQTMYRVNHCPSCGIDIGLIELKNRKQ